jgi:hypothetical protein
MVHLLRCSNGEHHVRVRLKGINSATKRLADGRRVTYWYAWRGGPQLRGEPGTPEFIASYNEAVARRVTPPPGVLGSLVRYYEGTTDFGDLADRTKADYRKHLAIIERDFGDLPLAALNEPEMRGDFKEWRDRLAKASPRQADYSWTVLARVLSVAKDRGKIAVNPCERGGRLYNSSRADKVWTEDDEASFLKLASAHMHLPFLLATWTAQRQGDLLRLPWSAYDGTNIRLTQRKSVRKGNRKRARRVVIPAGTPLETALDTAAKSRKG